MQEQQSDAGAEVFFTWANEAEQQNPFAPPFPCNPRKF